MKRKFALFAMAVVLICVVSCLKKTEYPDEPVISVKYFNMAGDSAELALNFTDGDGNFGLDDSTWNGSNYDCEKYYNIYLDYYELRNGQWYYWNLNPCPPNSPDSIPFYYRVPLVQPTGQFKAQDGEILIDMDVYYKLSAYDTCRFDVYIVDAQLNKSNVVQTSQFLKPN